MPSDTVIDGEIVALDDNGRPSFDLLQGFGRRSSLIVLYAFDLLMLRGKDVRLWPLEERRDQLRQIVEQLPDTIQGRFPFLKRIGPQNYRLIPPW